MISRLSKQKVVDHLGWQHLQNKWIFTILFKISNYQSHQVCVFIFLFIQLLEIYLFSQVFYLKLRRQFFYYLVVDELTYNVNYFDSPLFLISICQNTIVRWLKFKFGWFVIFFSCFFQILEKLFQLFIVQQFCRFIVKDLLSVFLIVNIHLFRTQKYISTVKVLENLLLL